jgi:hypothetical protein
MQAASKLVGDGMLASAALRQPIMLDSLDTPSSRASSAEPARTTTPVSPASSSSPDATLTLTASHKRHKSIVHEYIMHKMTQEKVSLYLIDLVRNVALSEPFF